MLRRSPLFATIAVASLALGIGANAAIFSVVDTLLLKALPYRDADRLLYVSEYWPHEPVVPGPPNTDFSNWRLKSKLAESLAAYGGGANALVLTGAGEPERVQGTMVTSGLLGVIGTRMALGRDFTAEEDKPGGPPTAILGYEMWQRRFGGSPEVFGKRIVLDGTGRTIVGVLPSGFAFPDNNFRGDLLLPMQVAMDPDWHDDRNFRLIRVLARAKPGVKAAALKDELRAIVEQSASFEPAQFRTMRQGMEVRVTPLHEWLTGGVRQLLLVLEAAVAMLLLIACLNIAGLQIARGAARRKELAVRAAIGAGRSRLIRQLLTESALLSGLGGVAGVGLGYAAIGPLRAFLPPNLHLADGIHMNATALWFTFAIAVAAGIIAGIVPAVAGSRPRLQDAMKEGRSASPARQRLQGALVIAEVAAAMVLLVGASLFMRTFVNLAYADAGFRPEGVLTLKVALPEARYPKNADWSRFFGEVLNQARAIPGVEAAAVSTGLPIVGTSSAAGVAVEGEAAAPPGGRPSIPVAEITPEYFRALGIPILSGRGFIAADQEGAHTVVVNQAFAELHFRGQNALGRRIQFGSRRDVWWEIAGIAGNVTQHAWGPGDKYIVYTSNPGEGLQQAFLVLQSTAVPADRLVSAATSAVHAIDPNLPVFDVATMEERLGVMVAPQRANMTMMTVLAALALLVASIGIFGVLAYFVGQRRHEIGIRLALGASRGRVLGMVLSRGIGLAAAGLALGAGGALLATRAIGALLAGVKTNDPWAYATAAIVFLAIAMAASWIPARAAAQFDPAVTLREQ